MKILAVPNWTFFDPDLCEQGIQHACGEVFVHYAKGDVDHGRTVTAFSGESVAVFATMTALCNFFLPKIELRKGGVHPFAGALDVAPFVLLEGSERELISGTRAWASSFSERFHIPVRLYEKAALPGQECRLPVLRGQLGPVSVPFNFGHVDHPEWGYSVVGVRDFLLAVNFNFPILSLFRVRELAREIRIMRESGDSVFEGVRSLAFQLTHQHLAQLSLNLTAPDRTSVDQIDAWVRTKTEVAFSTELIGVIRDVDLPKSTCLTPARSQIVPTL
jgi:glutamate formiminotransferase